MLSITCSDFNRLQNYSGSTIITTREWRWIAENGRALANLEIRIHPLLHSIDFVQHVSTLNNWSDMVTMMMQNPRRGINYRSGTLSNCAAIMYLLGDNITNVKVHF